MRMKTVGTLLAAIVGAIAGCTAASNGPSGDCGTLSQCCKQLSGANATSCTGIVAEGNANACAEAQSEFEGDNACGAVAREVPGGCSGLSTCCASLSKADQIGCNAIVKAGNATDCASDLAAEKSAGMCGGTSGGGSGCSGLSSCCGSLSSAEKSSCNTVVNLGDDPTCTEELTAYQESGFCGGSGAPDSGGGDDSSGGGGTGCSGLSSCCGSLPSADKSGCTTLVNDGVDAACTEALTAYNADGLCGGGGTGDGGGGGGGSGCSGLSSCCGSLPSADQSSCTTLVNDGVDADCTTELTVLKAEGMCGGGGTDSGGGNCAGLSSCCGSLPSADQAGCAELVSTGVDVDCAAGLEEYQSANYCN